MYKSDGIVLGEVISVRPGITIAINLQPVKTQ
jgi:hypothetical protein